MLHTLVYSERWSANMTEDHDPDTFTWLGKRMMNLEGQRWVLQWVIAPLQLIAVLLFLTAMYMRFG